MERNRWLPRCSTDGLTRGYADADIGGWLQERLQLIRSASSRDGHVNRYHAAADGLPRSDVSSPAKSAGEEEMRVFRSLVGPDLDADAGLLNRRVGWRPSVVVKAPRALRHGGCRGA